MPPRAMTTPASTSPPTTAEPLAQRLLDPRRTAAGTR
jgi:hypothetical protein